MVEAWTGEIISSLHTNKIKQSELAEELGLTAQYVSMVLNGKKTPNGMYERMKAAIEKIVERRASSV